MQRRDVPRVVVVSFLVVCAVIARVSRADTDDPVPPAVQESVDRGLAWLSKNQKPDGSWPQGGTSRAAVPSLAAMAFLARGHVPGQGPYGGTVERAVDFVLASQQDDGLLANPHSGGTAMYEHGVATVMLGEVYGMVDEQRRERVGRALPNSVRLILDAQHPNTQSKPMPYTGGWRYTPTA